MRIILTFLFFVFHINSLAIAGDIVPDRRVIVWRDTDFFGQDIQALFDSSLRDCENACLERDDCQAYTFNANKNACFLKSGIGEKTAFAGAFSGQLVPVSPQVLAVAPARMAELDFLTPADLAVARGLVRDLAHDYPVGGQQADDLRTRAREAEDQANLLRAMRLAAGAVALSDEGRDWLELSRLMLVVAGQQDRSDQRNRYRRQALGAAINADLRTLLPARRADALVLMAQALEGLGRGRDAIPALRLALALSPRPDIRARLDEVVAEYGFRVTANRVEADSPAPRICAEFSEPLIAAGFDYAPYVQVVAQGLAVEVSDRDLCLSGVEHGKRYDLTLRAGLPAASGETLTYPVPLSFYVRDRQPLVWFPGRAYVLPKAGDAGVPIVGVNAPEVELTLYRISDRNIVRALRERLFGRALDPWNEDDFAASMGHEVWRGSGELETELNREVTTLLPLQQAIADQPAGIYALQARVPGTDPWDTPPATQWFVISDLGLSTALGADGLHVFVRSLASADPVPGAQVQLLSRANDVLAEVATDAQGYAHVPAGLTAGTGPAAPAAVVVRGADDDMSFLSLREPAFDLSDRGVEGRPPAPPIDIFATTDRGAYRAGEVIHATILARDARADAIAGLPLTVILMRPDGVEYSRALVADQGAGGRTVALPLAANVPRGTWRLDIHADPAAPPLLSRPLLVEDFLPERIEVDLALPEGPLAITDQPELKVEARYLFGAPGADLAIEGNTVLRPARELAPFPGFVFGPADPGLSPEYASLPGDLRTDAAGRARIPLIFPQVEAPGQPLTATVTVRVSEASGRPVERSLERILTPPTPMIGIRPLFDGELPENAEARFQIIALGPDLSPQPLRARWTLNRVRTHYQWYALDGNWHWDPVTTRTPVARGELGLGAQPQEVAARLEWGRYELLVEGVGDAAGIVASVPLSAGWYGVADSAQTPDMLEVALDRDRYAPGDTATLRLVPRVAGKVLVTVMSNRLIHMTTLDAQPGENTVALPVTDDWGAGAYVTATLIQPMQNAGGHLPTRALGLAHATVDPGPRLLATTLDAPAEARPRGPLDVTLRVEGAQPGAQVYATVALVDVGILNITGFASPDPVGHYFGQRRLGMALRDLYGRLIDRAGARLGRLRSGGDAAAALRMQAPPPTEELVAQFSGLLTVGDDGLVRVRFDLPAFNGKLRLMAVTWSARGVGQAEAEVLVRDPVVVTASLPRFMAPGDQGRLLLELTHATGPAGPATLEITARGARVDTATLPEVLDIRPGQPLRLSLPVTAGAVGLGQITLALTTPAGEVLERTLALPIEVNDPEISRTTRLTLDPGQQLTLDDSLFAGLVPGSARATLTAGPIARLDVAGLLARLDRYPYGCTEQTTSRALPLLYFAPLAAALDRDAADDIPARIAEAITRVLANQAASGSFGLWAPDSGDLWLDAYVTDFLTRARSFGHPVPDTALRSALDNLRNQVNFAADFDHGGEGLAYALYVLAREGAALMGDLRYYADEKGHAFATPIAAAQLGAALAAYGEAERARRMFAIAQDMLFASGGNDLWRDDYGTSRRDAAALLALAAEAGITGIDRTALAARLSQPANRLSTQEAAWTLLAAHALIGDTANRGLTINGTPLAGPQVRLLDAGMGPTSIANTGDEPLELTLTTFGVTQGTPAPAGQGYAISRRYLTLDGTPVEVDEVAQGTRLVAVLTVRPTGTGGGRLMVVDPLPAGFEIDNPHLLRAGDIEALDWLHRLAEPAHAEFRQDRFMAAVDWSSEDPFRLAYMVRAVSPGLYRHPAPSVEDMYRPTRRAHGVTGQVRITP